VQLTDVGHLKYCSNDLVKEFLAANFDDGLMMGYTIVSGFADIKCSITKLPVELVGVCIQSGDLFVLECQINGQPHLLCAVRRTVAKAHCPLRYQGYAPITCRVRWFSLQNHTKHPWHDFSECFEAKFAHPVKCMSTE
jgi:hypothetical protein